MMDPMDALTLDRYRGVPLTTMLELKAGKFLRLTRRGSTLTVRSGEVWITEQGNPRDVVLRAGQAFTVARRGLALVEAFGDASLSLN